MHSQRNVKLSYEMSGALCHMQLSDMKYQCNIRYLMSYGITEVLIVIVIIIIIIIFVYCNWVSTRWQWLMFSTEIRPEVNAGKPKCKLKFCEDDEGQN